MVVDDFGWRHAIRMQAYPSFVPYLIIVSAGIAPLSPSPPLPTHALTACQCRVIATRARGCTDGPLYVALQGPYEAAIGIALLWQQVGVSCLAGMAVIALLIPLQGTLRASSVHVGAGCSIARYLFWLHRQRRAVSLTGCRR